MTVPPIALLSLSGSRGNSASVVGSIRDANKKYGPGSGFSGSSLPLGAIASCIIGIGERGLVAPFSSAADILQSAASCLTRRRYSVPRGRWVQGSSIVGKAASAQPRKHGNSTNRQN